MIRTVLLPLAVALALAVLLPGAEAGEAKICDTRAALIAALKSGYGERQVAAGIAKNGLIVELHAGPDGAWSLVVVYPDGGACLLLVGDYFQLAPRGDPS